MVEALTLQPKVGVQCCKIEPPVVAYTLQSDTKTLPYGYCTNQW